jgi:glycosyltransferase involved in cell wall biosynthesis
LTSPRFTFHVVGLPHTTTSKEHCACAYTAKVYKFCKMMTQRGHIVFHYGVEGSTAPCTFNHDVVTHDEYSTFFGHHDYRVSYYPLAWDSTKPYWVLMNKRAASKVKECARPGDFLCLIGGVAQQPIAATLSNMTAVEYGIGYAGTFAPFRVFESYAHMHGVYSSRSKDPDGFFYDAVIPNYFDVGDFEFREKPQDYVLYMGRMLKRKGLQVAIEATRRAGLRLVMAGQGASKATPDTLSCTDGSTYTDAAQVEFAGYADTAKRSELMGGALALIAPTLYVEPFGGVAVEAQLCGTPAVTTDWGAFPETVLHGVTGYRCRTLEQFVWALKAAGKLDRATIRSRAIALYSLERVGTMYEEYFSMLASLQRNGWYEESDRSELDWLKIPDYGK